MANYRYYIWKNFKLIDDCQRLSTVLNRLTKICRKSDPENDVIWVQDTYTDEFFDASELIPSFVKSNE